METTYLGGGQYSTEWSDVFIGTICFSCGYSSTLWSLLTVETTHLSCG